MASRQESNSSYYEMAKEIAKIEKELQMERWVRIGIHVEKTSSVVTPCSSLVFSTWMPIRTQRSIWSSFSILAISFAIS